MAAVSNTSNFVFQWTPKVVENATLNETMKIEEEVEEKGIYPSINKNRTKILHTEE